MNKNLDQNWKKCKYKNNRYREVDDYIEVEIYGEREFHLGKIDLDFLDKFTERTWCATKRGKNFYMYSGKTKKFPDTQYFHRLVFPGVDQVDHKDVNTLDNRIIKLRDALDSVNNIKTLFSTNKSGTSGVFFDKIGERWRATWQENKTYRAKFFSIKKYGDEEAKQKAIKYRQKKLISGSIK